MLNISIGILSWHSTDVLIHTLETYHDNGLLELSDDIVIYFQEMNAVDIEIANYFGVKYMGSKDNVGIGQGFLKLASEAKHDNILLLEHDWELICVMSDTAKRLRSGITLLDSGYDAVRYRHRYEPGFPHFSQKNYSDHDTALNYHDPEIDLKAPHLLDSLHWIQDPDKTFCPKIGKQIIDDDSYYVSTSRYASWTNNPVMYKKDFYLKVVKPFAGKGIELEGKISYHWARSGYNVAHGLGLFSHNDFVKYPNHK